MAIDSTTLDSFTLAALSPLAREYGSLDKLLATIDSYTLGFILTHLPDVVVVSQSAPYLALRAYGYKVVSLDGEVVSVARNSNIFGLSSMERQMLKTVRAGHIFYLYWGPLVITGDDDITSPQNVTLVLVSP
jgi:hypothetical protein